MCVFEDSALQGVAWSNNLADAMTEMSYRRGRALEKHRVFAADMLAPRLQTTQSLA
jgi:hypothetical protein